MTARKTCISCGVFHRTPEEQQRCDRRQGMTPAPQSVVLSNVKQWQLDASRRRDRVQFERNFNTIKV